MNEYVIELNQDEVDAIRAGIGSTIIPSESQFYKGLIDVYHGLHGFISFNSLHDQRVCTTRGIDNLLQFIVNNG